MLPNPALDPFGKMSEFKFRAAKTEAVVVSCFTYPIGSDLAISGEPPLRIMEITKLIAAIKSADKCALLS